MKNFNSTWIFDQVHLYPVIISSNLSFILTKHLYVHLIISLIDVKLYNLPLLNTLFDPFTDLSYPLDEEKGSRFGVGCLQMSSLSYHVPHNLLIHRNIYYLFRECSIGFD